jgi:arabinogalactan oligomer / maltooligosaccharide transport system permease protein
MATISLGKASATQSSGGAGINGRGNGASVFKFRRRSRLRPSDLWRHLFVWALIAFSIFPIYVVLVSSFDPAGGLASSSLLPQRFSLKNYDLLFANSQSLPFFTWMWNSIWLASLNALFSVMIGTAAAFAFSRLRFRGRKVALQALLLIQVFPAFLAIAAIYVMMERVSTVFPGFGIGSLGGLLLIYLASAMGVNAWLLKGFIDTIPYELDEAAKIDGASPTQIFFQIFLPLTTPVLAVVALLTFIGTFNEFILASLFLQDVSSRTVAVGLQQFIGAQFGANWGAFAAGSVIASIPLVALFLSLQRYIVNGLIAGSVKG